LFLELFFTLKFIVKSILHKCTIKLWLRLIKIIVELELSIENKVCLVTLWFKIIR